MALRDAIQRAALGHRGYGCRRVAELVKREGFVVSSSRVLRITREDNLLAIRRRKFVVTTDSDHEFLIYPNLVQHLSLTGINQLWVADITYIRLAAEFVYLAVVLDAFSRRVVGWALGRSLQTSLPLLALNRAIAAREPQAGVVHHSDRGSQYASGDYVDRLEERKMIISMSRPGRPWENARCESFIKTLKTEELEARSYRTLEELNQHLEEFIEQIYNRDRLHSALGYCSPLEFENALEIEQAARQQPIMPGAGLSFSRHQEIYPDVQNH
jgi:putative transposase